MSPVLMEPIISIAAVHFLGDHTDEWPHYSRPGPDGRSDPL